jgi:peptide/nickel transport system permease protein
MFVLFRMAPADPATLLADRGVSQEAQDRLLKSWGLDGSLWSQYVAYLKHLLTFDFGRSIYYKSSVWSVLIPRIMNTLSITIPGVLIGSVFGAASGIRVGWAKRGGPLERTGILGATLIRGTPTFVMGIFLLFIFSQWLGWLPGFGMSSPGAAQAGFARFLSWDFVRHAILPIATVSIFFIPENLLLMRAGILENRNEDYIELVRAKGVSEHRVRWHAARNSLLPVITWLFPSLAETVGGIIVAEVVFSWPGVGRELVMAIGRLDYNVAQAAFFLVATSIVLANLLADLVYGALDPRVVFK